MYKLIKGSKLHMFIKCDKHTKDKLQRIAKRNHRSINKEVEYMISMYIDEHSIMHNGIINNGTIYNIGTIKNQFVRGLEE